MKPAPAHLVTTDVWTSMGYEAENEERRKTFANWCVDADMMQPPPSPMPCSCTACPRTGAKKSPPRAHRRRAIGGLGRGRKPHARAKALMEYLLLGQQSA